MTTDYDAIVVGARCAGAPTAMLLARRGMRVLLVDRSTFPSDTVSTPVIHPTGLPCRRSSPPTLLEQIAGCPSTGLGDGVRCAGDSAFWATRSSAARRRIWCGGQGQLERSLRGAPRVLSEPGTWR